MSSPISLAVVRNLRPKAGQKSQANAFGGPRRVRVIPVVDKAEFMAWWAGVMRRKCGACAVEISRTFSVTEQTGRNWLDGFACPMGQYVDLAQNLWPEEFAARHGHATLRAAA